MADVQDVRAHLPLTPATFHILVTLADGPTHGYGIKHAVEERTDGLVRLGAGTLYAGIRRMEKGGLIRETGEESTEQEAGTSRWRFYQITRLGRQVLDLELRRLEADVAAARSVVPASTTRTA